MLLLPCQVREGSSWSARCLFADTCARLLQGTSITVRCTEIPQVARHAFETAMASCILNSASRIGHCACLCRMYRPNHQSDISPVRISSLLWRSFPVPSASDSISLQNRGLKSPEVRPYDCENLDCALDFLNGGILRDCRSSNGRP